MPSAPQTRFISAEGVDPSVVPSRTLSSGARIPAIGLGTFGSDHVTHSEVADAVRYAVSLGYRHFDCASVYGNEDRIGRVLKGIFAEGLRRDQVWITSKLWNDKHGEGEVIAGLRKFAERPPNRLSRSLSDSLALPQPSCSWLRCRFAQRPRSSIRSRKLHAHLAKDGGTG